MSTTIFRQSQDWQLDARVGHTPYGHYLVITSLVPSAR